MYHHQAVLMLLQLHAAVMYSLHVRETIRMSQSCKQSPVLMYNMDHVTQDRHLANRIHMHSLHIYSPVHPVHEAAVAIHHGKDIIPVI